MASKMLSIMQLILVVIFALVFQGTEGAIRRCFACRSRGELGDCRDPFEHNGTTVEGLRGVEAQPCASGWCAKITEGQNDDFDTATERMCVQRPPTDGEERCSDTLIDRKPVYMCFCFGDLCNRAPGNFVGACLMLLCSVIAYIHGKRTVV